MSVSITLHHSNIYLTLMHYVDKKVRSTESSSIHRISFFVLITRELFESTRARIFANDSTFTVTQRSTEKLTEGFSTHAQGVSHKFSRSQAARKAFLSLISQVERSRSKSSQERNSLSLSRILIQGKAIYSRSIMCFMQRTK